MDRNLEACWGDVANEQLVDRTKELLEHGFLKDNSLHDDHDL
jgi:hypothetical protein